MPTSNAVLTNSILCLRSLGLLQGSLVLGSGAANAGDSCAAGARFNQLVGTVLGLNSDRLALHPGGAEDTDAAADSNAAASTSKRRGHHADPSRYARSKTYADS